MAQIDSTFNFQGVGIEVHIGNPQGSPGTNPKAPIDAPSIPPSVVIAGNTKPLSVTVGSTKIQNPA